MSSYLDIGFIFFVILIFICIITRKWYWKTFVIMVTLIYYLLGSGVIGNMLSKRIDYPSTDIHICADTKATILLGAGTLSTANGLEPTVSAYDRILKSAQVYENYGTPIIISGGVTLKGTASEAEVYAHQLRDLGIPSSKMILEQQSMNTRQNAEYTQALLGDLDAKYCLVSDGAHLERAQQYFERYHVKTVPLASSTPMIQLRWRPNAYNLYMTQRMLHEWFGQQKQKVD